MEILKCKPTKGGPILILGQEYLTTRLFSQQARVATIVGTEKTKGCGIGLSQRPSQLRVDLNRAFVIGSEEATRHGVPYCEPVERSSLAIQPLSALERDIIRAVLRELRVSLEEFGKIVERAAPERRRGCGRSFVSLVLWGKQGARNPELGNDFRRAFLQLLSGRCNDGLLAEEYLANLMERLSDAIHKINAHSEVPLVKTLNQRFGFLLASEYPATRLFPPLTRVATIDDTKKTKGCGIGLSQRPSQLGVNLNRAFVVGSEEATRHGVPYCEPVERSSLEIQPLSALERDIIRAVLRELRVSLEEFGKIVERAVPERRRGCGRAFVSLVLSGKQGARNPELGNDFRRAFLQLLSGRCNDGLLAEEYLANLMERLSDAIHEMNAHSEVPLVKLMNRRFGTKVEGR